MKFSSPVILLLTTSLLLAACSEPATDEQPAAQDVRTDTPADAAPEVAEWYVYTDRSAQRTYDLPFGIRADFSKPDQYTISQDLGISLSFSESTDAPLDDGYVFIFNPPSSSFFVLNRETVVITTYREGINYSTSTRRTIDDAMEDLKQWETVITAYEERFGASDS